jgi:predicted amidophosphoribosyltransferase
MTIFLFKGDKVICSNCQHDLFPIRQEICAACEVKIIEDPYIALDLTEARVLNKLIRIHHGLFRESFDEYEQLLRLINGLGTFVDKHAKDLA